MSEHYDNDSLLRIAESKNPHYSQLEKNLAASLRAARESEAAALGALETLARRGHLPPLEAKLVRDALAKAGRR